MLITQRAFPLKLRVEEVIDVREETVLVTVRRAEGGMMSFKAEIRSYRVSSSSSSSDSSEISESKVNRTYVRCGLRDGMTIGKNWCRRDSAGWRRPGNRNELFENSWLTVHVAIVYCPRQHHDAKPLALRGVPRVTRGCHL